MLWVTSPIGKAFTVKPTKGLDLIISLLAHFISIAMATFTCLSSNAHFNQMLPPHFSMSLKCIVNLQPSPDESDNRAYSLTGVLPSPTHTNIPRFKAVRCDVWTFPLSSFIFILFDYHRPIFILSFYYTVISSQSPLRRRRGCTKANWRACWTVCLSIGTQLGLPVTKPSFISWVQAREGRQYKLI